MGCIQDAFADHSFDWVYLLEKKRWEPLRRLFEIRAETAKQQHKESGNLPIHEMLKYPDRHCKSHGDTGQAHKMRVTF